MYEKYRLAVREARFIRVSLLLAASVNALHWLLMVWFIAPRLGSESEFFALHSTVYFGVDKIGPAWRLIFEPLLGSAFLIVNTVIASHVYVKDRLAAAFMAGLAALLEALLAVTSFFLILQNL